MRLCLVTDRRRLTSPTASFANARDCLLAQARHAVEARIDLLQLRERDLEAADLAALTRDLLAVTRGTATRLVVNDRLDVALACGADGVHLRGDSIPVAAARRLAPAGFLVGRSVHSLAETDGAAGADYVIAGTVFATASKPAGQALLGLDSLRAIALVSAAPVLAIGGVTEQECAEVAETGVAGVAGIGLFMAAEVDRRGGQPAGCRATSLSDLAARLRATFDSVKRRP